MITFIFGASTSREISKNLAGSAQLSFVFYVGSLGMRDAPASTTLKYPMM
jgi:hypothetical protein